MYLKYLLTEGKKHDSGMLGESGPLTLLEHHAMSVDGHPMCVYNGPCVCICEPHFDMFTSPLR